MKDKNHQRVFMNPATNKKGELTTQQIVLLIILIMSFVVILYFLIRLNIGEDSEKEICHNSVVMKGNPVLSKGAISLNCQRAYVCLTKDGSCEAMTNPNIRKVEDKQEVYKVLAEEMVSCWWMFGQGKIDYVGDKIQKANYCSICSQVAFDESVKEIQEFNSGKINQDEFYVYLVDTPISEERETYAEYFFGTKDINALKADVLNSENNSKRIGTFGTINLDEQYFVMMGITSEIGKTYKLIGIGVVVLAFLTPVGWVGGAIIVGSGIGAAAVGEDIAGLFEDKIAAIMVKGDGVENWFMAPTIVEAKAETFNVLNCKDIVSLS